jgi:hypothetical protein
MKEIDILENITEDDANAMFTLSILNTPVEGECLDSKAISAFVSKRIPPDKLEQTIKHLNTCKDCFDKLTEVLSNDDDLVLVEVQ